MSARPTLEELESLLRDLKEAIYDASISDEQFDLIMEEFKKRVTARWKEIHERRNSQAD